MRVDLSRAAERDIDRLTAYGRERFGQAQVDRFLRKLRWSFDLMSDNPRMGAPYRGGLRRLTCGPYYVFYRVEADRLFVTTVRSTRMAPL